GRGRGRGGVRMNTRLRPAVARLERPARRQRPRPRPTSFRSYDRRRWRATAEAFERALPDDEELRQRFCEGLKDPGGLLWRWINDVYWGRSGVPEGLGPEEGRQPGVACPGRA